jgi:hypothetical protein
VSCCEVDRSVCDRESVTADPRCGPHQLADSKGFGGKAVDDGAHGPVLARGRKRIADLPEDLGLPKHDRFEPARHPEDVPHGVPLIVEVSGAAEVVLGDSANVRKKASRRLHIYTIDDRIDLRPIARREDEPFARVLRKGQQPFGQSGASERKPFSKLHRSTFVIDADDDGISLQENAFVRTRWDPDWVQ